MRGLTVLILLLISLLLPTTTKPASLRLCFSLSGVFAKKLWSLDELLSITELLSCIRTEKLQQGKFAKWVLKLILVSIFKVSISTDRWMLGGVGFSCYFTWEWIRLLWKFTWGWVRFLWKFTCGWVRFLWKFTWRWRWVSFVKIYLRMSKIFVKIYLRMSKIFVKIYLKMSKFCENLPEDE